MNPSILAALRAARFTRLPQWLRDDRGDLSTYIAHGILALAAIGMTGVVLFSFHALGDKLQQIVETLTNMPIVTGQ